MTDIESLIVGALHQRDRYNSALTDVGIMLLPEDSADSERRLVVQTLRDMADHIESGESR